MQNDLKISTWSPTTVLCHSEKTSFQTYSKWQWTIDNIVIIMETRSQNALLRRNSNDMSMHHRPDEILPFHIWTRWCQCTDELLNHAGDPATFLVTFTSEPLLFLKSSPWKMTTFFASFGRFSARNVTSEMMIWHQVSNGLLPILAISFQTHEKCFKNTSLPMNTLKRTRLPVYQPFWIP